MGRMELFSLATLDVRLNPCPAPRELSATLIRCFPLAGSSGRILAGLSFSVVPSCVEPIKPRFQGNHNGTITGDTRTNPDIPG